MNIDIEKTVHSALIISLGFMSGFVWLVLLSLGIF